MSLQAIDAAAQHHGLFVMGASHSTDGTTILIGTGPAFWSHFATAPERVDGQPDPLDRWSKRILPSLSPGSPCLFPSDGPPYPPIIAMALATGRFFQSPTGMMVHAEAGLMISIRGAILHPDRLALPEPAENPCLTCPDKPCATACPVDALSATHAYDVPACKAYLGTHAGQSCMTEGCAARRACPVSRRFGRDPAQSGFHMRAFTGGQR